MGAFTTDILPAQFNDRDLVALGLGHYFGSAGAAAFPPEIFLMATECKLTNYGNFPIFNAVLSARVAFTEAHRPEGQTTGWQSGPLRFVKSATITVPKIDAGKDSPFIFYLKSQSADFVDVEFLSEVTLQEGSDPTSKASRLIIPAHTRVSFSPFEPPIAKSPPAPPPPAPSPPNTPEKSSGKRPPFQLHGDPGFGFVLKAVLLKPLNQFGVSNLRFNEVKGKSALALSRDLGLCCKSAFVLLHKLHEAMAEEMRGHVVSGEGKEASVDGGYSGGYA